MLVAETRAFSGWKRPVKIIGECTGKLRYNKFRAISMLCYNTNNCGFFWTALRDKPLQGVKIVFKLSEIKELIELLDQTSVHELEIENENTRIAIRKPNRTESLFVNSVPAANQLFAQPQVVPSVPAAQAEQQLPSAQPAEPAQADNTAADLHKITSPMVGTFYAAPAPGADAFVSVGSKVNEKTVVCIVEAMKLMNEIEAEVKGEIVEVLVENGQLVEYGQPLFLVKKE